MLHNSRHRAMYKELRIGAMQAMTHFLELFKETEDVFYYDLAKELGQLSSGWSKDVEKLK